MSITFNIIKSGNMVTMADDDGVHTFPVRPTAFQYPGGEWHLKDIPNIDNATWVAMVRGADPGDLITAALLADAAYNSSQGGKFVLLIPYLPAARSDRGIPCGARVYADIINTMPSDEIFTLDAHSDVMPMMINCRDLSPVPLIESAIEENFSDQPKYKSVICPDKGAVKRAEALAEKYSLDVYHMEKTRDFETGKITGLRFVDTMPGYGHHLVVDDICDGGGTFMGMADKFKFHSSSITLDLWVTHGIFSGKADELRNQYKRIMTTDSHPGHSRLGVATTIIPVWPTMFDFARKVDTGVIASL